MGLVELVSVRGWRGPGTGCLRGPPYQLVGMLQMGRYIWSVLGGSGTKSGFFFFTFSGVFSFFLFFSSGKWQRIQYMVGIFERWLHH